LPTFELEVYKRNRCYKVGNLNKSPADTAGLFYFRHMIAVHLKELKFHSHHGLYAGEDKTGGPFEVNLSVYYEPAGPITSIEQTINYVALFEIVKQRMMQKSSLIETVAQDICDTIKTRFPVIMEIKVEIDKCSPPIENFQGKTGITLHKTFNRIT
jgi:7,8-dihydroneopterin aldolase/epimerase/oxygenase